jgi:zinc protease
VAEVNRLAGQWLGGKNRVITVSAPRKDSMQMPDARELLAIADSVSRTKVVAYVDSADNAPLVPHPPAPGRIVSRHTIPEIGVTEWTLSNGARVFLKPTNFKDDEILFRAFSPGGTSLAADSLFIPARTASSVVSVGGVGAFSATALEKALAGKSVSVGPTIGQYDEGMTGAASPRDADALLQLVYLYFTAPRLDSAAFLAYQARVKAFLANRSASPSAAMDDTLLVTLSQHHPRALPLTSATFDRMNLHRSLEFYRDRFADASDFTFLFVGNIDTLQLAPLVEQFIGGLPSTHRDERWRDLGLDYPRGIIRREVHKGSDPKSDTRIVFTGPFDFTRENVYALSSLTDVLSIRLRERLREQLGGTYGVGVSAIPEHYPRPRYAIAVDFGSAPERMSELATAVFAEIDSLKANGPRPQDLEKVKETQLRERQTSLRQNGFWLSALYSYLYNGWNPRDILAYGDQVKRLDAAAIREAARRYLDERNYVQVTLYPETKHP